VRDFYFFPKIECLMFKSGKSGKNGESGESGAEINPCVKRVFMAR
jgi:hypothetical protein